MNKDYTIGIYIRLSMADEDTGNGSKAESDSIGNQRMLINRYLDNHPTLSKYPRLEFADDGYTGTNFHRPQFSAMMEKVRHGEINLICVKDFSRFSRDYIETGNYLECTFPFMGVRFISINDGYDSDDYKGTTGGLEVVMRSIIYAAYSKDLSVKTTTAKIQMMKQGKYVGGYAPYGYVLHPEIRNKLKLDPEAAEVVRRVFNEALKGRNTSQIALSLNDDNIPTPGQYFKGKHPDKKKYSRMSEKISWTASMVYKILTSYVYMKPMNCPHHCEIYKNFPRSYKDLPLRIAEFGTVCRYEQSGELHGLTRVRSFTQDDAHIFCRPEQVKDEFLRVMDIISIVFRSMDFQNFEAQISLRDKVNREKYIGSDDNWEKAEQAIIEACAEKGLPAKIEYGEAAFYGPKLDFMVKDAIGRRWQLGTIQVDYNLPERFELEYMGSDNQKHRPVMIHRAPFGSMERFVAVLIEHTAGKFPLWLTPEQVVILPISEKFNEYAEQVKMYLKIHEIRAIVDDRNEKIGRKIRDNEMKRIPYMLIVGEKEAENGEVSVRRQGEGDKGTMKFEEFAKILNEEVQNMINKW